MYGDEHIQGMRNRNDRLITIKHNDHPCNHVMHRFVARLRQLSTGQGQGHDEEKVRFERVFLVARVSSFHGPCRTGRQRSKRTLRLRKH